MRLIDADQLKKNINRNYIISDTINQAIDNAPTITPESLVRHGRWEEVEDPGGDSHWMCSSCGIEWYFEADGPVENGCNYCPNCGAKMDLKE